MADEVAGNLASAGRHLAEASDAAANTRRNVEEVAAGIARDGFPGVAKNLGRAEPQVRRVSTMLDGVRATVTAADGDAATVTDTSTPDEVIEHLGSVVDSCGDALDLLDAAMAETVAARTHIAAALHGGSPEQFLAELDNIHDLQRDGATSVGAAKTTAESAIAKARAIGATPGLPAPPTTTRAHTGPPLSPAEDRPGAQSVAEPEVTPRRRRRGERAHGARILNKANEKADGLAKSGQACGQDIMNILSRPTGHAVTGVRATPPASEHVNVPEVISSLCLK